MESGFKRLWRRKKSKDRGDASRTASSTGYSRNDSIVTQGRPSNLTSRPLEKLNGSDYLSISSGNLPKTKSGNRIQPILIGISRPGDFTHRPETAVSFNTAVQRAADTARVSQDRHRNTKSSAQEHRRSVSGRSVDILKVAGKLTGYKSRFNEEIAERNLDETPVPPEAEQDFTLQPAYIPSSRYQEEVADRNASGLYGSKTSLEYERATSLTSRSARTAPSPITSAKYQHPRSQPQLKPRSTVDQSAYHSRQYSSKSRDGGQSLPVIPQERISEERQHRDEFKWTNQPVAGFARVYSPTTVNQTDLLATKPLPELPRPDAKSSFPIDNVPRQIHSSHSQPDSVSIPSPPARHPGRVVISRDSPDETQPPQNKAMDNSRRSPSLFSSASAKGATIANERKIMDLTHDDVYSESSSTYGYSQYSPVLEQANTGRYERSARHSHGSARGRLNPTEIDPIPEISQESIHRYMNSLPDIRERQPKSEKPSKISFSTINTMASLPPRTNATDKEQASSAVSLQKTTSQEDQPHLQDNSDILLRDQQQQARSRRAPLREESMSRVQRAAAALEARSASQSPKPTLSTGGETVKRRSFVSSSEEPSTAVEKAISALEPTSNVNSEKPPTAQIVNRADLAPKKKKQQQQQEQQKQQQEVTTNTKEAVTTPQRQPAPNSVKGSSTPSIYDSPDSLRSVDYTNPGESFGVRTRDFAITPAKSVKTQRKKSDPQLLQRTATENAYKAGNEARGAGAKSEQKRLIKAEPKKSSTSQAKRSASAAYVPAKSEFDEEAFARKQAEAKAALIRLQQSLQEDFITLPSPVPPRRRPVDSENDGSPVAPSSIVYPQSILSQPVERPPILRAQTQDAPNPPTSFKSKLTAPDRATSASSMYNRPSGSSSRKGAPASLKHVEAAATPINPATLPPSLQQLLFSSSQQPRSPGEISLSSFPIPSSRPGSEHDNSANASRPTGYAHMRRNSNRSMTSIASQFSIPFHMIPDRSSSYRDALIEED